MLTSNTFNRYWFFQIGGWGLFILMNAFFAFTFKRFDNLFIGRLLVFVTIALLASHIIRIGIVQFGLMQQSLVVQITSLIIGMLFFAIWVGLLETMLIKLFNLRYSEEDRLPRNYLVLSNIFHAFVYLFIWNLIYVVYHFREQSRNQQMDTLKLQTHVKDLELKTIKGHINPHFIFNALNSIRALIDENPARARLAVTGLSNILRSSMQVENVETVALSKELDIVKDYLTLEQIRFEERLMVEFNIEDDALLHQVPVMMLQTLVENAIKHGIGKYVDGGRVQIIATSKENHIELIIRNTGFFDVHHPQTGFGLQSTSSRLYLLYGKKATFTIHNIGEQQVEAIVKIPIIRG
jgi:sensor histidine kinase YesM